MQQLGAMYNHCTDRFFLPFQVGRLEVLPVGRAVGPAAAVARLAAVDADQDEQQQGQSGADDHGDQRLLGHVVWGIMQMLLTSSNILKISVSHL